MKLLIMPLLLLFSILALPFLEIGVFVKVGGSIGAGNTILLTLITGIAGIILIRVQGLHTLSKIQTQVNKDEFPFEGIYEGFLILLAGFFLLIPGFITDTVGLLLFIPFIRKGLYSLSKANNRAIIREDYSSKNMFEAQRQETNNEIIDAEYKDISNDDEKP